MKNVRSMICILLSAVFITGCLGCNTSGATEKAPESTGSIAIMTWNIQALFDGVEDGNEYDEYRESTGWGREKYRGRLTAIAGAIGGMERRPDIIALQEIESAQVMADLAGALSPHGYGWVHFAGMPEMSLGLGLLSRFPVSGVKTHSVTVNGEAAPRPMLELRVNTGEGGGGGQSDALPASESLALFVCHWKSKLGGNDATENVRRASARILLRRLRELARSEPELPVIVMGDLNENYDEFYRRSGKTVCALLPDDPRAAECSGLYGLDENMTANASAIDALQKDFIVLSKNKPPVPRYFPSGVTAVYSPWAGELTDGSYYYKSEWETIDHFLLAAPLFDEKGWDFENCESLNVPPFVNAKGRPAAYNPRTGSGLSDHLPLLLTLKKY